MRCGVLDDLETRPGKALRQGVAGRTIQSSLPSGLVTCGWQHPRSGEI
jgi:hypothetical protein